MYARVKEACINACKCKEDYIKFAYGTESWKDARCSR